ncbi:hypothetical protein FIV42_18205 [Persicimonas caeni]|uniref:Amidase domain-containing protein n=1 Tax=Persicimonas caeni TaxID=2292766 RepID=A0A4Y6PWT9_PERCE|nr:amidase family protein [Persicimonas caeni]QDG52599.1 hypothetical protein FIV42_18205 [Persicimonas caeni]QED33821.1 hypothetical protein FRD00_18200 [Persicimonas caeni]
MPLQSGRACVDSAQMGDPDGDSDGAHDDCDNCPDLANPDQADSDHDGRGDLCDGDIDGDGIANDEDTCRGVFDPSQQDSDSDGLGDVCDACPLFEGSGDDGDGDTVARCLDNCPATANTDQADADADGVGDACDNCPNTPNAGQADVCAEPGEPDNFRVEEATVADIHRAIRTGEATCSQITDAYLQRIARFDLDVSEGAPINAFVMLNESLREQASALDEAFEASGELTGPLHCVPFVIKTNFDSTDTTTTNGSFALADTWAPDDGFAVAQMRERGALLVGSTGMDEFARGIHGIGGRHGKTGNAYDTDLNSGGSSAGSGAAVAASFAVGGTGTDNCGSLSIAAAYGGLVTMRSTFGLVSLDGVFPSGRLDTVAGPLARSVRDMALFLDAMAMRNSDDPLHTSSLWRRPASFTEHLDPDGLQGRRIGVLRQLSGRASKRYREPFEGGDASTHKAWTRALGDLERLGAEIVENVHIPSFSSRRYGGGLVVDVNAYLKTVDSPVDNFEQLCRTRALSRFVYDSIGECLEDAECRSDNPWGGLHDGAEAYERNRSRVERAMDDLELDALVLPADAYGAANRLATKSNCILPATSGLPAMVVPAGLSSDTPRLPVGLMFIGRAFDEPTLIEIGYAYEQGTGWRRPPTLASNTSPDDVPRLDLAQANALRRRIARAAFDEVLADGGKFDLSASRFRTIARRVLEDAGADYLLGGTE